jgi:hypothetical protein
MLLGGFYVLLRCFDMPLIGFYLLSRRVDMLSKCFDGLQTI